MKKILNSIEIPNGIGFEILPDNLAKLLKRQNKSSEFLSILENRITKILENYGIEGIFDFYIALSVESINNEKHIHISKPFIFTSFYNFFNKNGDNEKLDDFDRMYTSIMVDTDDNTGNIIKNNNIATHLKKYLKERILELDRINNLEQMKNYCPSFYYNIKEIIEKSKYDPLDAQRFFIFSKERLIKNLSKIIIWADKILEEFDKPIEDVLDKYIDKDKFKLFLAGQYAVISPLLKEPIKTMLLDSIYKLINSIENKDVLFKEIDFIMYDIDGNNVTSFSDFNIQTLLEILEKFKKNNFIPNKNVLENYKREDFEGKSIDQIRSLVLEKIEKTIKTASDLGSENVDASEMKSKLDELDKEIKSGKLTEKELIRAKHQYKRLKMVLMDIKPRAIQKALPPFKGFYVYFYDNGMVAIDKIDYGSRLFVMPVSTYKYILDNKIDKLRIVGKLDSVKAFKHDERTNWLDNAKTAILNSTEYVTEADKKYNEQIDGWNFGYTQDDMDKIKATIELLEKDESLSKTEKDKIKKEIEAKAEKKRKKKQQAEKIDKELKTSNPKSEEDMTKRDRDELSDLESKLDAELGTDADFAELYEAEKRYKKKGSRCISVSKYGKDRTIDENGMYHCEMCNTPYSIEQKSRLDYHHFVPISKGGPDTLYNGLCLCTECHRIIHYEPYRIPDSAKEYLLSKIEKHIKEENPELLEEFYDYKRAFFSSTNDLIVNERTRLKNQGIPDSLIDIIISEKEELFTSETKKSVKGLELKYHK